MTTSRQEFLERVRQAVAAGNRAGDPHEVPARGNTGYQGASRDLVQCFAREFEAAGGKTHLIDNREALARKLSALIQQTGARRILLELANFLAELDLANQLREWGCEVQLVGDLSSADCREAFFAADVGISGVECLIAETGSMVVASRPGQPRSVSLLPPVHIAVARRSQIVPDLFDLFSQPAARPPALPSSLTLITGPSKTGDIELRLVTGVHGPGEVHVLICSWE